MAITTSLHRAAKLQEKIEQLRKQLGSLLDQVRAELASTPAEELSAAPRRRKVLKKSTAGRRAAIKTGPKPAKLDGRTKAARALKTKRHSPLKGVKRSSSPSGPLAPAVVRVLQAKKQPMHVRDILDGLTANGYRFNTSEPKKNLAARIYRLKGVKQVSAGLFAAI